MKTFPDQSGILQRISEGDEKAFGVFFDHYYTALWPFVFKFTKSETDTEEVLQETFVRVWLHRDRVVEIENVRAWIYKVASRECLSFLRKNLSSQRNITDFTEDQDFTNSPVQTPFEVINLEEVSVLIQAAIERMPSQRKRIYKMSRDEGLKPSEIAQSLSLSVSTVKNVLSTSLKEIRSFLTASGFEFAVVLCLFLKFLQKTNWQ